MSPRAHAPRAPQANTRLSWNYSREGRDGLRPQLPTRDGLGGGVLPRPQSCDQLEPVPAGPPGRGYSGRSGRRAAEGTWARERNPAGPGQTSWTEQHPLAGPRVLSPRSGRGCPCARRRPASTPGRGDLGVRAPRQKGRRGRGAAGSLGGKCGAPGPRDGGRRAGTLRSSGDLGGALRPPGGAAPTPARCSRGRRPRPRAPLPAASPAGGDSVQACLRLPLLPQGSAAKGGGEAGETNEQNPQPRSPKLPSHRVRRRADAGAASCVDTVGPHRSGGREEVL